MPSQGQQPFPTVVGSSSLATDHGCTTHRLSRTSSVTLEAILSARALHKAQDSLKACSSSPFRSWWTSGKCGNQTLLGSLEIIFIKASHHTQKWKTISDTHPVTWIPLFTLKHKRQGELPWGGNLERESSLNLVPAKSSCRLSPETKTHTPKGRWSFSRGVC